MEAMVSLAEAASALGVHPATVRRAIRRGEIPAVRVGKQWRIRPSDLEPTYHPAAPLPAEAPQDSSKGRFTQIADELARTGARTR